MKVQRTDMLAKASLVPTSTDPDGARLGKPAELSFSSGTDLARRTDQSRDAGLQHSRRNPLQRGFWTPTLLERSLTEIVRRHEVLRATFPTVGHRPVLVVHGDSGRGTLEHSRSRRGTRPIG